MLKLEALEISACGSNSFAISLPGIPYHTPLCVHVGTGKGPGAGTAWPPTTCHFSAFIATYMAHPLAWALAHSNKSE